MARLLWTSLRIGAEGLRRSEPFWRNQTEGTRFERVGGDDCVARDASRLHPTITLQARRCGACEHHGVSARLQAEATPTVCGRQAEPPRLSHLARGEIREQIRQQEVPAEVGVEIGDRFEDQLGVADRPFGRDRRQVGE